jgi:chorismate synthase
MGSSFGILFRVHTFGESHGGAVGAVIDGCPPGITLDLDAIQHQLDRRRPGQSDLTTARAEPDRLQALSGLQDGVTLGSPIALQVANKDARPGAYADLADVFRPSHADFTTEAKYGLRARSGGGRASARETVGRVLAGAVARQVLAGLGVEVVAWVDQVGDVVLPADGVDEDVVAEADVDRTPVRCPDEAVAEAMADRIRQVRGEGDSVGGAIRCVARGVPAGLGEPVFDKLHADLAKACMSLPATRGFEIGSGFSAVAMRGSAHNDPFVPAEGGGVSTASNRSGGVQGGISNGQPIRLRLAFKPPATIFVEQDTVNRDGQATKLKPRGRHDPCVVPRAVPIVEAMVALVLLDHLLRQRALTG